MTELSSALVSPSTDPTTADLVDAALAQLAELVEEVQVASPELAEAFRRLSDLLASA